MFRSKLVPILAAGVIVGTLAAGPAAFADHQTKVSAFLDKADLSLADAIQKAEKHTDGKAIHATVAVCGHDKDSATVKTEQFKVTCLAKGKFVEVCVDNDKGTILATNDTTTLPIALGTFDSTTNTTTNNTTVSLKPFRVQKASDLIGKNVENTRGENLGEVQDLAIDPERGRIVYAVLSFGGFLGMGEKWFAVPIGALTLPDHAKHFVLAVEKDRLKTASGFEKDRWPAMGDTTWGQGIHEFYQQRPYWMDDGGTVTANLRIQKASEIMGRPVQNDRGEKVGELKDLVIDPDRGRIAYAVLSFGGFLGMGDKLFAIPGGVLQMPGSASYVVLNVDKDRLKNATGFDKDRWPNMADPTFSLTTYEYYGQKPYWTDESKKPRP